MEHNLNPNIVNEKLLSLKKLLEEHLSIIVDDDVEERLKELDNNIVELCLNLPEDTYSEILANARALELKRLTNRRLQFILEWGYEEVLDKLNRRIESLRSHLPKEVFINILTHSRILELKKLTEKQIEIVVLDDIEEELIEIDQKIEVIRSDIPKDVFSEILTNAGIAKLRRLTQRQMEWIANSDCDDILDELDEKVAAIRPIVPDKIFTEILMDTGLLKLEKLFKRRLDFIAEWDFEDILDELDERIASIRPYIPEEVFINILTHARISELKKLTEKRVEIITFEDFEEEFLEINEKIEAIRPDVPEDKFTELLTSARISELKRLIERRLEIINDHRYKDELERLNKKIDIVKNDIPVGEATKIINYSKMREIEKLSVLRQEIILAGIYDNDPEYKLIEAKINTIKNELPTTENLSIIFHSKLEELKILLARRIELNKAGLYRGDLELNELNRTINQIKSEIPSPEVFQLIYHARLSELKQLTEKRLGIITLEGIEKELENIDYAINEVINEIPPYESTNIIYTARLAELDSLYERRVQIRRSLQLMDERIEVMKGNIDKLMGKIDIMDKPKSENKPISISDVLHQKIVDFLISIPNIHESKMRRTLLYGAGLDSQIEDQVSFDDTPVQFFQILIHTLERYGKLKNGRSAIEAILKSAIRYVGQDRKAYCSELIQELQTQ